MKKLIIYLLIATLAMSCSKEKDIAPIPSNISTLSTKPIVGGALLKWTLPKDSNFTYVEIKYQSGGITKVVNVSKYTDSVQISGLLNRNEYTFELQTVHHHKESKTYGTESLKSTSVRPIKRPIVTQFNKIDIRDNMTETFTQETTEGPKSNLVDNNIATYWHTAWSAGVATLPHWIKVNYNEPTKVDRIGYFWRQGRNSPAGRPEIIGVETSEDGTTWKWEWTSEVLDVANTNSPTLEKTFDLPTQLQSKFYRVMFIQVNGTTNYVNLGEFRMYVKVVTDLELEAEKNYVMN